MRTKRIGAVLPIEEYTKFKEHLKEGNQGISEYSLIALGKFMGKENVRFYRAASGPKKCISIRVSEAFSAEVTKFAEKHCQTRSSVLYNAIKSSLDVE